jgi:putative membrane protein
MDGLPFLHTSHRFSWDAWHLEPSVVGGALIVIGLYAYALTLEPKVEWRRVLLFATGAAVMFVALASPLDVGADRSLALHMLQHVLLTTIGPPLVILGLPREAVRRLLRLPAFDSAAWLLTAPLIAAVVFIVNMWLWHLPPVYEAALDYLGVHIAMHLAFMATGLLFWWPVIEPLPEKARTGEGGKLLYLFVTGFPMGLLALLLVSSGTVVYDHYEAAQPVWGMSALIDQQIAGIIMGGLGELASFAALSLIFLRFLDRDERENDQALGRGPAET